MNQKLADAIQRDNAAEEAGMHADDRKTCWTHQTWAADCAESPLHTRPSIAHHPRPA
ncbi:hypothetical protein [Streptomyces sp. NPDC051546]|uniref:hypothetical protein n=1 Tax=Streptomyces sp. NPDC051546 TaxID=3365655 RepID=UPI0037AB46E0